MRYAVIAMFSSASATLAMASIGIAQNGQDGIHAPGAKTPSAIIAQGHQDVAHAPRAKTHATTRNAGTTDIEPEDTDRVITLDQQKAIPYRACINARGWRNGRLICTDDGETVQLQQGREIEGPFSPQY